MLPDNAVRRTESPHGHLPRQSLPRLHHAVHRDDIVGIGPIEAEAFEVVKHEITLSCLVEHEFDDLRAVFAGPVMRDFCNSLDAHAPFVFLYVKVLVCCCADHELHF